MEAKLSDQSPSALDQEKSATCGSHKRPEQQSSVQAKSSDFDWYAEPWAFSRKWQVTLAKEWAKKVDENKKRLVCHLQKDTNRRESFHIQGKEPPSAV